MKHYAVELLDVKPKPDVKELTLTDVVQPTDVKLKLLEPTGVLLPDVSLRCFLLCLSAVQMPFLC